MLYCLFTPGSVSYVFAEVDKLALDGFEVKCPYYIEIIKKWKDYVSGAWKETYEIHWPYFHHNIKSDHDIT